MVGRYAASNVYAPQGPGTTHLDQSLDDPIGHGTRMAILAAGKNSGIAPHANIVSIKMSCDYKDNETGEILQITSIDLMTDAINWLYMLLDENGVFMKAVGTMSIGKKIYFPSPTIAIPITESFFR